MGPLGSNCHAGRTFTNGIGPLQTETLREIPYPSSVWLQQKHLCLWIRRGHIIDTKSAHTFLSDSQPPELWEMNFCCYKPLWLRYFCYSSPNWLDNFLILSLVFWVWIILPSKERQVVIWWHPAMYQRWRTSISEHMVPFHWGVLIWTFPTSQLWRIRQWKLHTYTHAKSPRSKSPVIPQDVIFFII